MNKTNKENNDSFSPGLFIFIGLIIVSICIGTLTEQVWGWLTFGGGLILLGLLDIIFSDY